MRHLFVVVVGVLVVTACSVTEGTASGPKAAACFERLVLDGASPLCECSALEESRSTADFKKVPSCAETPRGFCCSKVDAKGEADSCQCWKARCYRDKTLGRCACGNGYDHGFFLDPAGAEEVASCDDIAGVRCCGGGSNGCWCSTELDGKTCDGGTDEAPVTTCRATQFVATECAAGATKSTSCDGIAFKQPSAPSSSSSSSSGGSGQKCAMKTGSCKTADDCTCGAACGVVAECSSCTKRCNFYCETDADCVRLTSDLLTPRLNCNQTGPSSGIKVCE